MAKEILAVVAGVLLSFAFSVAAFPLEGGQQHLFTDSSAPKAYPLGQNVESRVLAKLMLLSALENMRKPQWNGNEQPKMKRTCLLNAGLSHSCDYRDVLTAIDEGKYLGSDLTPGRK